MQVVVRGLMTQYDIVGSADAASTVLILHGWGDDSRSWKQFAGKFAKKHRVVMLDLPGFGGTEAPKTGWGLDDYARFVHDFLTKVAVRPQIIIGHSNGGAIAIRGLGSGELSADKLILLASAGIRGEYKGRLKALRYAAKAAKTLTAPLPKSAKQRLRRGAYKTIGSDMLVAEHMQETFKKVVSDDVRADAAKLTLPTLLVYGDHDDQAPPAYGRMLHEKIAGSKLEIIPETGHFLQIDQPAVTQKLIEEFVS